MALVLNVDARRARAAFLAIAHAELVAVLADARRSGDAASRLTVLAREIEQHFARAPWPGRCPRRNAALVLDRASGATLAVVGARFGITRERARAIYRAGLLRWYVARNPERDAAWRALVNYRRKIA